VGRWWKREVRFGLGARIQLASPSPFVSPSAADFPSTTIIADDNFGPRYTALQVVTGRTPVMEWTKEKNEVGLKDRT
jgi:hypothetical protein